MGERRRGTESSATRALLLDTAERLLLEEGYAAVGVRRVAREAGVTPALVLYYFGALDDLLLALLRRNAEREMESLEQLRHADRPLSRLWERGMDREGAAITAEFLALANHRKDIRSEIAAHAARFRQAEAEIVATALGEQVSDVSPVALSALIAMVSRSIVLEDALGLTEGHAELLGLVRRELDGLESDPGQGVSSRHVLSVSKSARSTPPSATR